MGKILCLLLCLAVFISAGYALSCYNCISDKVEACKTDSASRKEVKCGDAVDGFTLICFHKIELDKKSNKENATYSCESVKKGTKLDRDSLSQCKATSANFDVKECEGCTEDLCNSAPIFSKSLFAVWWLPFLCYFTKFWLNQA